MREVIFIKKEDCTPVQFTHLMSPEEGWIKAMNKPNDYDKIVYLGNCSSDGDMFAAYYDTAIVIYKGHLNSGKY